MAYDRTKDVEFEGICEECCYGILDDYRIIIRTGTGYVNATNLCKMMSSVAGTKKTFDQWMSRDSLDELIKSISLLFNERKNELIYKLSGDKEIGGTYIHPKLVLPVAFWVSPASAIYVAEIMNAFSNIERNEKHKRQLKKKDNIIDELTETAELRDEEIDQYKANIEKLTEQNANMATKLANIAPTLVILKNPKPAVKSKAYYVIQTKKYLVNYAINKYKGQDKDHANAEIILRLACRSDDVKLWKIVKTKLADNIECNANHFRLRCKYTEEELIKDINDINQEKTEI